MRVLLRPSETTITTQTVTLVIHCMVCHEKFGLPKNGPPSPDISKYLDPLSRYFEIFGPPCMELIFQELDEILDEIFTLPMKFLDPPLQRVNF